jgi:RNA binding exosome subunit
MEISWMDPKYISFIHIQTICHATEDPNKVLKAIQQVLPEEYINEVNFKKKLLKGHYGNPIEFIETKIERREIVSTFVKKLLSHLNQMSNMTNHADNIDSKNQNVYIRLNKQYAFQGLIELCSGDSIRIHFRLKRRMKRLSGIEEST